ncbi:uncharacterized protein BXZ73DRAFT_81164 [Epithele typhae]|uniref:uncharacterized protein n=1 Tax=Epithele typhae TaxID=378194 RepID=UPI00200818BC|nr:uncharacterized protein BXZ73DRAFT_81164 [Epithele typhae]KAH9916084.1 hypothetical protein BXZ73DRAFT_81164 [Epithele typhae]
MTRASSKSRFPPPSTNAFFISSESSALLPTLSSPTRSPPAPMWTSISRLSELGSDFPPFPVLLFLQCYPDYNQLSGPTPRSVWAKTWYDYQQCAHASMDWIARAMRTSVGTHGEMSAWRWTPHSFSPSWVIIGEDYGDVLSARSLQKTCLGADLIAEAMRSRGILRAIANVLGVADIYVLVYCDDILVVNANPGVLHGFDLVSVVSGVITEYERARRPGRFLWTVTPRSTTHGLVPTLSMTPLEVGMDVD